MKDEASGLSVAGPRIKGAKMVVDTVIFDLDGTLADTAEDIKSAVNTALRRQCLPELTLPEVRKRIGEGGTALIREALAKECREPADEELATLQNEYLATYAIQPVRNTTLYDGASMLLTSLRKAGIRVALCTNKFSALTDRVLFELGLSGCFHAVVSGDSLPLGKPDPAPLYYACACAGGTYALMVGDTINDVIAARAAGFPVACVDYGYHSGDVRALGPEVVLSRLSELLRAARQANIFFSGVHDA